MLAKQRQETIYKMLNKDGAVDVSNLVNLFGTSIETVRKDLLFMEQKGLLKRVHGGAVKLGKMKIYEDLKHRNAENTEKKRALAEKAADFIEEGDLIAIDAGSTAVIFSEILKEKFKKLTAVTHSKDVFDVLSDSPEMDVILCAGHYLKDEKAFYGEFALDALKKLHVEKAFIFVSALSIKYGVFDFQKELYQIQKEMLSCADKIYICADSSKLEKTGLLKICDMREDYTYITDSEIPGELKKMYLNNGYNIISGGKS